MSLEPTDVRPLTDPELARLARARGRLMADWKAGLRPGIESLAAGEPEPFRSALIRDLVEAEVGHRRGLGERPTIEEYLARFPDHASAIAGAFPQGSATFVAWPTGPAPAGNRSAPSQLQGYRLVSLLGRGGFGEVWKAEGPGGVMVALKFVRLADAQGAIEVRAFETIKGIRHPNLMSPFGAWHVEDQLVIGMELADGTLLDRHEEACREGLDGIPGPELVEYFAEAAKGIDYLNEHRHTIEGGQRSGIQHRDIKPQNILLVGGGVKVADFGLARLLERSATAHSGAMTPAYSAPEFFRGQTSDQSDQYSLAVTYCLLRGGRLPFGGSMAALMHGHLHQPPDLTMLPPLERRIVGRALAKDPRGRWPDCRTFVGSLERVVLARPSRSRWAWFVAAGILLGSSAILAWTYRPEGRVKPTRDVTETASPVAPKPEPTALLARPASKPTAGEDPTRATALADPAALAGFLDRGAAAYASGDFDDAIVAYSEAIALDSDNAVAANNRGSAYYKAGFSEAALDDFARAIRLDPSEPLAYFNRGTARFALGDPGQAAGDFTRALELAPDLEAAYTNRGLARQKLGDQAGAEADFARAAALRPARP